ncbi:MAG: DNA polymerase IV [Rhizobiales bacterium]|nr:DNA polymerase IV [Hyphomicrobiales bacterium]NRB14773.1 DNA polymerase IV [Hyphomicrobiales bacterium]
MSAPSPLDICRHCKSRLLKNHDELKSLSIVHMDCDSFYASVEKRDNPDLRNKPLIIGGDSNRSVVSTACYIARTYGVKSAMPMFKAKKLCPHAVILRGNMQKYTEVSREIVKKMNNLTPMVEQVSVDEAFLDLSGTQKLHKQYPSQLVARLAKEIESEVGITISIGLSYNKFLAKMASDLEKPKGFSVLGQNNIEKVLAPFSVSKIWGVGKVLGKKLNANGIETFADLQKLDQETLLKTYGKMGSRLKYFSVGKDNRQVKPAAREGGRKSIGRETTFFKDIHEHSILKNKLWDVCEQVHQDAKHHNKAGYTVTLKLKTNDFQTLTRSHTLPSPTMLANIMFDIVCQSLAKMRPTLSYRLVGVSLSNLTDPQKADPLDFLEPKNITNQKIENAMDEIREKFGRKAVIKGRSVKNKKPNNSLPEKPSPQ